MKPDYAEQRRRLVESLVAEGIIRSPEVRRAMLRVPREEFVWPHLRSQAYIDAPLPLGETGQTISAPHMVAIMLEELRLAEGLRVLEIGAGSGYNAALLAEIVSPTGRRNPVGRVVSVERVPDLVEFARSNLERTGYADRVEVVMGDGTLGWPSRSETPSYDRIVVTAAAPKIPHYLKCQLKPGGIIVIPVGDLATQTLIRAIKEPDGRLVTEDRGGCVFVPLVGDNGYHP